MLAGEKQTLDKEDGENKKNIFDSSANKTAKDSTGTNTNFSSSSTNYPYAKEDVEKFYVPGRNKNRRMC